MTGFIKGLFRSKPKATPEAEASNGNGNGNGSSNGNGSGNGAAPQASRFYFLEPDDAKTFGNIEYMRTAKSIRRSFPKAKLGAENAVVRSISSTEISLANSMSVAPTSANPSVTSAAPTQPPAQPAAAESQKQRTPDSSMDMFRNMARDLRKR